MKLFLELSVIVGVITVGIGTVLYLACITPNVQKGIEVLVLGQ